MKITNLMLSWLILFAAMILWNCAEPALPPDDDEIVQEQDTIKYLNNPDKVDLVTWNIEYFPKSTNTILRLSEIINKQQADIYCIQELTDYDALTELLFLISGYSEVHSEHSYFMGMALIYKTDQFDVLSVKELFMDDLYPFASRPPLEVSLSWNSFPMKIIDLHMKCCDDGVDRRVTANEMLYQYLVSDTTAANVIVVGDWNDDYTSTNGMTTMAPFLSDTEHFHYVTNEIARRADNYYDSYPSYPSFIDHILISASLFDEENNSHIETLRLDKVLSDYFASLSDHRPVYWQFKPNF